MNVGHGDLDALGRFVAVRLVLGVELLPYLGTANVKNDGQVAWLLLLDYVEQSKQKSVDGRGVESLAGNARIPGKGKVCPVN